MTRTKKNDGFAVACRVREGKRQRTLIVKAIRYADSYEMAILIAECPFFFVPLKTLLSTKKNLFDLLISSALVDDCLVPKKKSNIGFSFGSIIIKDIPSYENAIDSIQNLKKKKLSYELK